jgi:thiol-disulfide isomerase/thioredoxin
MSIERLSKAALIKVMNGEIKADAECIVKFYSNECHLCHSLQEYYLDIAKDDEFSYVNFYAFNIADFPSVEKLLGFNGVPTIVYLGITALNKNPKIRVLPEPEYPNEKTWYTTRDIKEFIKDNTTKGE